MEKTLTLDIEQKDELTIEQDRQELEIQNPPASGVVGSSCSAVDIACFCYLHASNNTQYSNVVPSYIYIHTSVPSFDCRPQLKEKMAKDSIVSEKMKLLLALLTLQLCFAGFHIVSRVALNIGVSKLVYPVYRNIIALLLLGPFAYFLEKNDRPPLTFSLLVQFFLLALLGITANQGFYILGLYYASPTFASAMQNSVPAITFVMASALRLEQVNTARKDGWAKVLGTIASVGGATVITVYKGPPLLHNGQQPLGDSLKEDMFFSSMKIQSWTWGCIYLLGHCLSWAGWMVFQAPVLKKYPAKLSLTAFTCFFGLIQFLVIAAFVETDSAHWRIQSGEEIFTILYAGIVSSGIVISLQTWCIHKVGPVFVAIFQPVQTILVAVMAWVVFGDQLYSGGIIGAVLIMIGLYSVLWGKTEETRAANKDKEETLTTHLLDAETKDADIP
ncbi:WAT1-related protein At3g18200 [Cornus florida]|uniref:WAT1-related protein At3g18200 n=1 Tax=Cornus florida TaxID=4283 RepID=UPI0028968996|nr:WAT1-related protein At3g18200 [Cornus florida]